MIFLLYLSIPIGIDPVETNEASATTPSMSSIFLCCCHKSERKDKEWRDLEEDFAATTVWGAAPFLTGSTTSY
jgi:hypothetical protein